MRQNLAESALVLNPFKPAAYALASMATTGYFINGTVKSGSTPITNGIDLKGYDEGLVVVAPGAMPALSTLIVSLLNADTNSDEAATIAAMTDDAGNALAFATILPASGAAGSIFVGRFRPYKHKRYAFVKAAVVLNAHDDADPIFGIQVFLSKAKADPVTQSQTVAFMD